MNDTQNTMNEAKEMILSDLEGCAVELIELQNTGILRQGIIRQVSNILKKVDQHRHIDLASRLVEKEILKAFVRMSRSEDQS